MTTVPTDRIRALNEQPINPTGDFVLVWMTAFRRPNFNFTLDRAVEHATALNKPIVIVEALRLEYPEASERVHSFVIEGMRDNAAAFENKPVTYYPYVERERGEGSGLIDALATSAAVIVTDDWPCLFVPHMQRALASRVKVRTEAIDSNGLYPMHDTPRVFGTAFSFRVHLQKTLAPHLKVTPKRDAFHRLSLPKAKLPSAITLRWKPLDDSLPLAELPIRHDITRVDLPGGHRAATKRLSWFIEKGLSQYAAVRSEPEVDGTSKLSAYLHFGHVSVHQILAEIAERESWSPDKLGRSNGGKKEGWWKLTPDAESFIDELVTWRELAFNFSSHLPSGNRGLQYLPEWAKQTIEKHATDPRKHTYTMKELENAQTHDPLWNATQGQLVRDGWFHNYLRMLWGKKIYEWSPSADAALERMELLMNRYSLDGRDPVSYSGYYWILGRYDRAWGPERPIFGTLRYMSSENTARKISVKRFIEKYA